MKILSPLYKKTYCEANGSYCQIPVKTRKIIDLRETFGYFPLKSLQTKAVCDLLCEMITDKANKELWKIIESTRNKSLEDVKYLGGNAATLLVKNKETFSGANLENTVLENAYLGKANFLTANLCGCDLISANLAGCIFDEKILDAKLGKNKVLLQIKGTEKLQIKELNKEDEKLYRLISSAFENYKIGKARWGASGGIVLGKRKRPATVYMYFEECDIPSVIEFKEKIYKEYSSEVQIYFNEGENIEKLFEKLEDLFVDK